MNKYLLASAAAVLFGVATAIQHRAAHSVPIDDVGPIRLFLRLLRKPRWLAGRVLDTAAVGLQALALRSGSLVVVQCIVACGIVAAIGTSAAMDRRWPHRREWFGSTAVVAGVILVSGITSARHDHQRPSTTQWIQLAAVVAVLAAFAHFALRSQRPSWLSRRPSLILGACAGVCFALGSGFLKIGSLDLRHSAHRPTAIVALGAFVILGVVGNVAAQRSFQIGAISDGLPALVAAEPIAALLAGMILFHERIAMDPRGAVGVAGLIVVIIGVITATGAATPGTQSAPP
jgi:drug/metabolite transporter (DMT)-like permease